MKRFGEKLRTLRKQHGLSIRKLTREFGFSSHSYISLIEAGKKRPSMELIIKVADRFGVSVDQLVLFHITDPNFSDTSKSHTFGRAHVEA